MFKKEDVQEALRIVATASVGAYRDGNEVIKEIETIKDEELQHLCAAVIAATIEAGKIMQILKMVAGN